MARPNLHDDGFTYDEAPAGFRAGEIDVGRQAGGRAINVRLYELPPGERLCPYHYEYEEEWLLVLAGTVQLRSPQGTEPLPTGAVVCFPPGPDGAHTVTGTGTEPARVLMFSSSREPAVAVYPDSDKLGVWPPNREDAILVRREDAGRDYWDRETAG
ncbi:MAG TPA: cupin domain-containing protein [Solirubrobacteraceae bacterium]|nr:cupin domain-containing protein [Solirubrobacteraceae bacterium]